MMNKPDVPKGFTLIEVMITMVIALVVLAGMSSLFVTQTRTAQSMNNKSEIMSDLFLASQIMQADLRNARRICWNSGTKALIYEPLGSLTVITPAACVRDNNTGQFQLVANGNFSSLFWRPENAFRSEELIRNMVANTGISVDPNVNIDLYAVRTITLTSEYRDSDSNKKTLEFSFKVWPRN